jgi:hypothetical protein
MSIPYLAIKAWMFTSAVVSIDRSKKYLYVFLMYKTSLFVNRSLVYLQPEYLAAIM